MAKIIKAFVERDEELFKEIVGDYLYEDFEALTNTLPYYTDEEWEHIVSLFEKSIDKTFGYTDKEVSFFFFNAAVSKAYTNYLKKINNG